MSACEYQPTNVQTVGRCPGRGTVPLITIWMSACDNRPNAHVSNMTKTLDRCPSRGIVRHVYWASHGFMPPHWGSGLACKYTLPREVWVYVSLFACLLPFFANPSLHVISCGPSTCVEERVFTVMCLNAAKKCHL